MSLLNKLFKSKKPRFWNDVISDLLTVKFLLVISMS